MNQPTGDERDRLRARRLYRKIDDGTYTGEIVDSVRSIVNTELAIEEAQLSTVGDDEFAHAEKLYRKAKEAVRDAPDQPLPIDPAYVRSFLGRQQYQVNIDQFGRKQIKRAPAIVSGEEMRARFGVIDGIEARELSYAVPLSIRNIETRRRVRLREWAFMTGTLIPGISDNRAQLRLATETLQQGSLRIFDKPIEVAEEIADDLVSVAKYWEAHIVPAADRYHVRYMLDRLSQELNLMSAPAENPSVSHDSHLGGRNFSALEDDTAGSGANDDVDSDNPIGAYASDPVEGEWRQKSHDTGYAKPLTRTELHTAYRLADEYVATGNYEALKELRARVAATVRESEIRIQALNKEHDRQVAALKDHQAKAQE
ncbi:MAG: hypothetical protein F4Y88_06395, partial [Chloroflexi bacterium]|nr:hypothetical protein [Chloroflexota bacterium]